MIKGHGKGCHVALGCAREVDVRVPACASNGVCGVVRLVFNTFPQL